MEKFFISFFTHGLRFFEIIFILYNIPVKCTRAKRIEMIVQAHTQGLLQASLITSDGFRLKTVPNAFFRLCLFDRMVFGVIFAFDDIPVTSTRVSDQEGSYWGVHRGRCIRANGAQNGSAVASAQNCIFL